MLALPVALARRHRRRLRSWVRSRQSPAATALGALETSANPLRSLATLRRHRWRRHDAQYLLLAALGLFALALTPQGRPFKLAASALALALLAMPVTQQFVLPFLPIAAWLVFFYACG
jgi:hypothetical protein